MPGCFSLGFLLTALHLLTLFVIAPLVRRLPDPDRKRMLRVTYADGAGVLRDVLSVATSVGFTNSIEHSKRITEDDRRLVVMDIRFHGRPPVRELLPQIMDLQGVERVTLKNGIDDDGDSL